MCDIVSSEGVSKTPRAWKPNASIPEYRNTLESIVELSSERGASVWLLTAPIAYSNDAQLARLEALPNDATAHRLLFVNGMQTFAGMRDIHDSYTNGTKLAATATLFAMS